MSYSIASLQEIMACTYIAKLIFDKCRRIPNRKLISHTIKELFGWQRKTAQPLSQILTNYCYWKLSMNCCRRKRMTQESTQQRRFCKNGVMTQMLMLVCCKDNKFFAKHLKVYLKKKVVCVSCCFLMFSQRFMVLKVKQIVNAYSSGGYGRFMRKRKI